MAKTKQTKEKKTYLNDGTNYTMRDTTNNRH